MGFRDKTTAMIAVSKYIFSSLPRGLLCPLGTSLNTWSPPQNVPGYQGQQEIVCLVGCKRASLWEGGGLNGRLSPRRKESHWINSLTVRFATTKSPVKLPCELCCVRDRIIQVILKESKFSSINLQSQPSGQILLILLL